MKQIQQTYHDALFYASATINKNTDFYLTSSDYKVLIKLIHQSTMYSEITIQNDTIAKYIWLGETTVRDSIKSLIRMKYIETKGQVFNNRGGYKSKRTISINWNKLSEILKKSNPTESQEDFVEDTIPTESNTSDLSNDNKEVIVDVIEEQKELPSEPNVEILIVPDYDPNTHIITPPTPEELEAIKDFDITEKSVPRTVEQNYIEEILSLYNDNENKVGLLGQSDSLKLEQIFNSGTAKKFDVTIFKNIFGKL
ncbi:hypothetical protein FNW52_12420 [Flavobacterium sp. ZT3R18]|uniref:hypothetical protein n=1 Tax=Flavobacterium sp. ZT3R18 TaxID=2594429 RepID=UPI001179FDE3|nr:hypothetical protein [Flavobacterium sp. ZT3R18]TRX34940.1 hypothetical protein FNW52_12420 [Flavobacterium sp. ZT3R18]